MSRWHSVCYPEDIESDHLTHENKELRSGCPMKRDIFPKSTWASPKESLFSSNSELLILFHEQF
jgi:hypothetical protein